ncbi:uncharacterized protein LOC116854125 [Odontomachus brunneus]|uniref:uncharacterized protein LOC116854125 n=1 Tax=Odontomachus brunneus TaxID=486640 RepID=UPI0013F1DA80|nr:uncharacterized protein LOC116854125 [Odontomachus brunneus]
MGETWLHHYTPESNRQSAEWTARDEPNPKRGKTQQSAGKVMASVFWDAQDLKRMLTGKKFSTNEEIIAESEAYFEAKEKSYYKNDIEKLHDRYNRCIALEGNYVE